MNTKTKVRLAVILPVLLVAILIAVFFMPFNKTRAFTADEFHYDLDYSKELANIPILAQKTGYTCNVVSMAIVETYLGIETTERDLRSGLNLLEHAEGMLPNEYLEYANEAFAMLSYSVALANPTSEAEILNVISASLERDLPAVIFYSAKDDWNKPHYNTHYAVIYGIDMKNKTVKISNPYGYLEELSFAELYEGLDFTSYKAQPLLFRLGRRVGMIKNNNVFVLESIH